MFNTGTLKPTVVIVCEPKMKVYASLLVQLIGSKDDTEDQIVGIKDGSIEAAIWEEKHYIANEPQLSLDMKIIFIGESDSAKAVIPNIEERFSRFGIRFGWRGNRAAIHVDKRMLKKDEYDSFLAYSKAKQQEFTDKAKVNALNSAHPLLKWAGVFVPYAYPAAVYALVAGSMADKKIKNQQYQFAVHDFYMEHLAAFLEA